MADIGICTIIAKNYLAFGRSLVRSFCETNPGGRAFVLIVDEDDGLFEADAEPFEVIYAKDLGIPDFESFVFRYTLLELSTALKPFFLEYLFSHYEIDKLYYFDPDILIFRSLSEISALLDDSDIVLTPHLLDFLDDDHHPSELQILQSGCYNLGFIGLARGSESRRLLTWWQEKMLKHASVDIAQGLFTDQRWIDLVPGFFSGVRIIRDPGCNVAYWNLKNRLVTRDGDEWRVNGGPLTFFHFSGFDPNNIHAVSKHQDRYVLSDLSPATRAIFEMYARYLVENDHNTVKNWPYSYGHFEDDVRIPKIARIIWGEQKNPLSRWGNPFETSRPNSFRDWLNESAEDLPASGPAVTRLGYSIWRRYRWVNSEFPNIMDKRREAYVRWLTTDGEKNLDLHPSFIEPLRASLRAWEKRPAADRLPAGASRWSRPYFALLRQLDRIGLRSLLRKLVSQDVRLRIRDMLVGDGLLLASQNSARTTFVDDGREVTVLAGRRGLNLIGYLNSETGIGEVTRSVARSLLAVDYPFAVTSIDSVSDLSRKGDISIPDVRSGSPYTANLLSVGVDRILATIPELGDDLFHGKTNVGYWFWEAAEFPQNWRDRFTLFDEIWVASAFTQAALAAVSPVPVVKVPLYLKPPGTAGLSREDLGLPADRYVFLFVFDALSVAERKNPLAVAEAFKRAFGTGSEEAFLAVKANNLDLVPDYKRRLGAAMQAVGGKLIEGYIVRDELSDLYRAADAFVSLHRSEGFGLTIAEAMQLAKPVIVTAYSGNMEFTTPANSYLVDYELVARDRDYFPYEKGGVWADPSVEHAAELMRYVMTRRDETRRRGEAAAQDIDRRYGDAEMVGQALSSRLELIYKYQGAR